MTDFASTEYKECLSLLKHYDERHQSLVKFAAGMSSAVPSLLMSIYGLRDIKSELFWELAALVSVMTSIGLLSIFAVMVQNRLYFIYPARQVNSIRKAFLLKEGRFEFNNQMYTSINVNAFKIKSAHTILNAFVCLQIGVFVSLAFFAFQFDGSTDHFELMQRAATPGLVIAIATFFISSLHLHLSSQHPADTSVHGEKPA